MHDMRAREKARPASSFSPRFAGYVIRPFAVRSPGSLTRDMGLRRARVLVGKFPPGCCLLGRSPLSCSVERTERTSK